MDIKKNYFIAHTTRSVIVIRISNKVMTNPLFILSF